MAKELVLITGVSGHVGFRILATALATNYKVRATVRNPHQINLIKAAKSIQPYLNGLEIVIVPDMFEDGAFDEALKDVAYVVHVASPLACQTDNPQTDIIDPAINGTMNVLSCAYKFPAIKRIVVTSSSSVLMTRGAQSFPNVLTENDIAPRPSPPYGNYLEAYMNGKVLALHASLDWVEANKPSFDIIHMLPAFVIGSHELATNVKDTISGSNSLVLGPLLGNRNLDPVPFATVHVEDVARAHIKALDPNIKGNQAFLLSSESEGKNWDDAIAIARKSFPVVEEKSLMPLNGTQLTTKIIFDSSKAEIQLGIAFKSYEVQVQSLVSHYLAIVTAE